MILNFTDVFRSANEQYLLKFIMYLDFDWTFSLLSNITMAYIMIKCEERVNAAFFKRAKNWKLSVFQLTETGKISFSEAIK